MRSVWQGGSARNTTKANDSVTTNAEDYIIYDLIALTDESTNTRTLTKFQVFHKTNSVGIVIVDTSKEKKVPQGGGFIKAAYFEDPLLSSPMNKVFFGWFCDCAFSIWCRTQLRRVW